MENNSEAAALAAALAVETVAFFAILARLIQVQVPALRRWPTQRSEGGIFRVLARRACRMGVLRAASPPVRLGTVALLQRQFLGH